MLKMRMILSPAELMLPAPHPSDGSVCQDRGKARLLSFRHAMLAIARERDGRTRPGRPGRVLHRVRLPEPGRLGSRQIVPGWKTASITVPVTVAPN